MPVILESSLDRFFTFRLFAPDTSWNAILIAATLLIICIRHFQECLWNILELYGTDVLLELMECYGIDILTSATVHYQPVYNLQHVFCAFIFLFCVIFVLHWTHTLVDLHFMYSYVLLLYVLPHGPREISISNV